VPRIKKKKNENLRERIIFFLKKKQMKFQKKNETKNIRQTWTAGFEHVWEKK
jgi:hypothetical protein